MHGFGLIELFHFSHTRMNTVDDMMGRITDFLHSEAKTETIIGQSFQLGEFTCVPVMSIGMGFGGGGGEGKSDVKAAAGEGTGAGGGAGLGMGPVGFLVSRGADIHFIPARGPKGLNAAFEKLPDVVHKLFDKSKKEKDKEKDKEAVPA